jgi:hypothetical protein
VRDLGDGPGSAFDGESEGLFDERRAGRSGWGGVGVKLLILVGLSLLLLLLLLLLRLGDGLAHPSQIGRREENDVEIVPRALLGSDEDAGEVDRGGRDRVVGGKGEGRG